MGFNYRNAPAVAHARDLVASGRLGRLESIDVRMLADYSAHPDGALSWRFDPQYAGTGVLGDLASHGFDLALHVGGESLGGLTELVADQATFITERPIATGAVSHYARRRRPARGRSATRTPRRPSCVRLRRAGLPDLARAWQSVSSARTRSTSTAPGRALLGLPADGGSCGSASARTTWTRPGSAATSRRRRRPRRLPARFGMTMGFDDLKVVECRALSKHPHGLATRRDHRRRRGGGEVVDAMVRSYDEDDGYVHIGHRPRRRAVEQRARPDRVIGTGAMGAAHVGNLARWVSGARPSRRSSTSTPARPGRGGPGRCLAGADDESLIASDDVDAVP